MNAFKEYYVNEVVPAMVAKFSYKNIMEVPKIEKIVINMGLGEAKDNSKAIDNAVNDMTIISGQKPIVTKARKSIANFKLRECTALQVSLSTSLFLEFVTSVV